MLLQVQDASEGLAALQQAVDRWVSIWGTLLDQGVHTLRHGLFELRVVKPYSWEVAVEQSIQTLRAHGFQCLHCYYHYLGAVLGFCRHLRVSSLVSE